MWNEKDMWRGQGMCVGGSAVGVRRQRVLYSIGSLVTGRKNGQLHHMLRAFWQTYVWDGPSEDVSKAVLGGGAWTFWTEFWNSYLFPWDHDFKASIPFFFYLKKKKGWKPWEKKKKRVLRSYEWSLLFSLSASALQSQEKYLCQTTQGEDHFRKFNNFFLTSPLISPFSSQLKM